jgi:2-polyprenyl-3-methyl-5-hydroxy-6-metoxy-1,4-benzoquinol methylase
MEFYSDNADMLFKQYESVSFETVHKDWLDILPSKGNVLDIGCGSGRDSAWFAKEGLIVTAVEPSQKLINLAKKNHPHPEITWIIDHLPTLNKVSSLNKKYDLILMSAVWMHLTSVQRKLTINVLNNLLSDKGKLVITLRHGEFNDDRVSYPLSVSEVKVLAKKTTMSVLLETPLSSDELGRGNVQWQTIVLGH